MMVAEKMEEADRHRKSNPEEAISILLEIHKEQPDHPDINYRLACLYDGLGKESQAVSYYVTALENGLMTDRANAFLGLGSTYRCLGEYDKSLRVFEKALAEFPTDRALCVFHSLTLYNLGRNRESVGMLLLQLLDTTSDADIKSYDRALRFYADRLDEVWK